jgi:hypothetical protein
VTSGISVTASTTIWTHASTTVRKSAFSAVITGPAAVGAAMNGSR